MNPAIKSMNLLRQNMIQATRIMNLLLAQVPAITTLGSKRFSCFPRVLFLECSLFILRCILKGEGNIKREYIVKEMLHMGYILPVIPIQRMQYASRMEKAEQGIPVVSCVPPIQNDTIHKFTNQKNSYPASEKKRFHEVLSEIEGKGLLLNETV
jgi:hypothetical protein